jgi:acyl-CoA dehydrogenase
MSDQRVLLAETAERTLSAIKGQVFAADWHTIDDVGLRSVLVPEDEGGFGGNWSDAFLIVKIAGRHAVPLPVGESILAKCLARDVEPANAGALSIAPSARGAFDGNRFTGTLDKVSWGREVAEIVTIFNDTILVLDRERANEIEARENLAGEPRDNLRFESVPVRSATLDGWNAERVFRTCALIRAAQIAGALDAALALAVQYTRERKQFGRPLAAFQAIQQQLAVLAEETAAAHMAAAAGFHALDHGEAVFECAAAKLRANQAAAIGASIAHQVHGAMGFTQEYPLQKFTRRLWAWRSEFGNERHWAAEIGARVAKRGADNFWPDIVRDKPAETILVGDVGLEPTTR